MSRTKVVLSLLFAVLAFVFVFSAYARANQNEPQTFTTAASVSAAAGESGQTKAVNTALNNAVLEALAMALPEDVFSKNFNAFAPFVLKDAGAYIQSYKVLATGASGGMTHAVVEATVVPAEIKRALSDAGLLDQAGFLSNIAVFIDANSVFEPQLQQWWQVSRLDDTLLLPTNTIGNAFADHGFTFLPADGTHARAIQGIRNNIAPMDVDIKVVGDAVEADAVVLGSVTFTSRQDRSAMGNYHVRAVLDLRVMETATGQTICSVMKEAGMVSEDQDLAASLALMEAAQLAAEELSACITQAGTQTVTNEEAYTGGPQKISLTVTGKSGNLTDYTNFRRTVTNMDGVTGVNVNSLSSDGMRLNFNYDGTTQMLIQRVADFNFPNFTVKVQENGVDFINYEILDPDDEPQFTLVDDEEQPPAAF